MELQLPQRERMESEDSRSSAPVTAASFQLVNLLLPETMELLFELRDRKFTSSYTKEMIGEMEQWWNSIVEARWDDEEIVGLSSHDIKFRDSLLWTLGLIYHIQYLCDRFLYDIMQWPQVETQGYSARRFATTLMITKGVQAKSIPMTDLEFSNKVSTYVRFQRDVISIMISILRMILLYAPRELPCYVSEVYKLQQRRRMRHETYPDLKDSEVIGRHKEKKTLLHWLSPGMESGNNFSTTAIVGQGGLGKTTLAHLVFDDAWVSNYFNLQIWFRVSTNFNVPELKRRIISWGKKQGSQILEFNISLNHTTLDFVLMKELEGKKLLLVLDDVWNEDPSLWESLMAPLLAAEYTRVIVTTRSVLVAEAMQTTNLVRLPYLSEANSLEILKQCAFQHHSPEKLPRLMKMGKKIVKKCGGLPLVVKSLAAYLRSKNDGVELVDSIPDEILTETIFPNLKRSYDHLTTQLKCCFIYCSMFPEGYCFSRDELVRLWIAQGYFWGIDPKKVEDDGDKCFDRLQKSSFFDFSHCEANVVRIFKIPVFIHALAKHIAGNEYLALSEQQCIPRSVCHLYADSVESMENLLPATAKRLHTFVLHDTTFSGSPDFILDMIRVRALKLVIHNVPELPGLVGNVLKPLRYLRIESFMMEELPKSIVNLCHLQVLDLSNSYKLKELPQDIGKLVNLRTLCLNGCTSIQELPITTGDLSVLQNLHLVGSPMRWMHPAIRELTTLRRLHYKRNARSINSNRIW